MPELLKRIQHNAQMAGHLSLIFERGGKGSKSLIDILNLCIEHQTAVHDAFKSIAWSFKHD